MVTIYNLIDFIFLVSFITAFYIGYEKKIYIQIFEYFKIFILITLSAKLASTTAFLLQNFHITSSDTYTTLILIAFIVNILIIYFSWKSILKFTNKYINNKKIKIVFEKFITFVEVLILLTFITYIIMQLYISKIYIYDAFNKTYFYPLVEHFYISFLGDDFLNMLLNSNTGTNYKEVIFKSLNNSI